MLCSAMRSQTSIGESTYSSRSHARSRRPNDRLGAGVLFGFAGETLASRIEGYCRSSVRALILNNAFEKKNTLTSTLRAHLVKLKEPLHGLMAAPIIVLLDGDRDGRVSPCGHDGIILGDGADGGHVVSIVSVNLRSERRTVQLDPSGHIDPAGLMSA